MAEDRRIRKTKRSLKQALFSLLRQKPFEQITVKDICEVSETSRITFYTHYDDKFALLDELFRDFSEAAVEKFQALQEDNNPSHEAITSYCNLFDSVLDFFFEYTEWFHNAEVEESPYLRFLIYKYILEHVEHLVEMESGTLRPKYSLKKTTWFLCYGLWGFINQAREEGDDLDVIREQAHGILIALLNSEVFVNE